MKVRTLALLLASVFHVLMPGNAYAHGDHEPKHGGIIGMSTDDIVVELVMEKGIIVLHVHDENDAPIPSEKMKGSLTLIPAQRPRQEVKLVSAGGNKLTASGLKPAPGDRLRARLWLPNGDEVSSSFLFGT